MNNYIIGIDVGSSKICIALGKLTKKGEVQIIGVTSSKCEGVKKSIVVNIDSTAESIKNCMAKLKKMVEFDLDDVYVALHGSISELIHNKGVVAVSSDDRAITSSDVKRVIESTRFISVASDREIIGVEPQQFIVDGYDNIKDPVGMSGTKLEADVHVITVNSNIVDNLIKSVNKAGYNVKGLCFEPKIVSNVVLSKHERESGCALVDVGTENINIAIIKNDNIVYIDNVPLGGDSITHDIALGLKIPFEDAENLKRNYANIDASINNGEKINIKLPDNQNLKVDYNFFKLIVQSRIEELYELIRKKLISKSYYNEITNVVVVGGGIALVKGSISVGRRILDKNVRVGSPNFVGASNPIYASAVGIVSDIGYNMKSSSFSYDDESSKNENKDSRNKNIKRDEEETNIFSKVKEFITDLF
ncbi:cell division protein FtsA [Clostridium acetobutylicum]|uniref:Cell division protein FtsA n=1 Tax=Clostridium acetobutylicum (strain ATCC 824 / DSM 792 / JCM 1419 / IAM 19013 / LMG 5710 / NBRC 13948 / NRRL B-527 / VKM B-1787 / 2291 / W) TaxID=272562 RepID=Q97IF0_CLOAB|nr:MULTISPECIES: cell division protein FtsA [Clostridium]AAK79658.1 Cell division protein, ftsA [Clostridium acetobutylicum ATCC 824]ADZ20742.1 Cell division protein, ftsA [Clostridium acetobutylicum EA 2018]AEI33770.1 cell division protein, ftsA [Clostridium acetobutylicum DSM 1731]AWV79906.1 cell division protein FtsA [Clostridium acetobutylicum]MBC2394109.1 cell division protein FtsA [Clostridium acetobutylicum]